jgi:hypothetical protein
MAVVGGTISTPVGIGIGIHFGSSGGSECATMDVWYNEAAQGNQNSLDLLVTKAGLAGGVGIAASSQGKDCAKAKLQSLLSQGLISGPTGTGPNSLPDGTPNLLGKYVVKPRTGVTPTGGPTLSKPGEAAASPWWLFPAILVAGGIYFYVAVYHKRPAAAA